MKWWKPRDGSTWAWSVVPAAQRRCGEGRETRGPEKLNCNCLGFLELLSRAAYQGSHGCYRLVGEERLTEERRDQNWLKARFIILKQQFCLSNIKDIYNMNWRWIEDLLLWREWRRGGGCHHVWGGGQHARGGGGHGQHAWGGGCQRACWRRCAAGISHPRKLTFMQSVTSARNE